MAKQIKPEDYIVSAKLVKVLETKFNSDLYTDSFDTRDFPDFLCAQAYGAIGKEVFYDAKMTKVLDVMKKSNNFQLDAQFYQGMITHSIIQKINIAEKVLQSLEFQKTHTIDMSKVGEGEFDYATQAFIMFYAYTQGYKFDWDKVDHAYSAFNFSDKSKLEFSKKSTPLDPQWVISGLEMQLGLKKFNELNA